MNYGCHLPVYGLAATREVLLGFARRMEALGYDSLWASDHVVIPYAIASRYPYNPTGDFPLAPSTAFLEPLVALGLVAELGDGWHAAFPSAAKMKAGLADLATACGRVGRDVKSLTISARLGLPARQDADALVREIRALADLGVSHLILESRVRDLDDMITIYEKFARDVRPRV